MEVIAEAVNGRQAIERFQELRPDVIFMDIDMPEMDGVTAMKHIMSIRPTPTIVISSMTDRANIPFETLRLGVIDFFPKPSAVSGELGDQVRHLLYMVRNSVRIRIENIRRVHVTPVREKARGSHRCRHLLVVGGTLGSVGGLLQILSQLPSDPELGLSILCKIPINPVIASSFLGSVESFFGWETVWLASSRSLQAGSVYFLPPESSVRMTNGDLSPAKPEKLPCLDELMIAAGESFGKDATLILLAGDLPEGFQGLTTARARDSWCLVQDETTALFSDWSPEVGNGVERFGLEQIIEKVRGRLGIDLQTRGA